MVRGKALVKLRAGTMKDWKQRFPPRYKGVIRDYGSNYGGVTWECEHDHRTSREALDCASAQLARAEESSSKPSEEGV